MRQLGEQYGRGALWLPEFVGAVDAMRAALPILQQQNVPVRKIPAISQ